MHFKNGREAKIGDQCLYKDGPVGRVGFIVAQSSTGDTCNISVLPHGGAYCSTITSKEAMHIDDALTPCDCGKTADGIC